VGEYEFAVEVTAGPPTSVFCHTKASIQRFACPIPADVQLTVGDWSPAQALLLWIAAVPLTITAMLHQEEHQEQERLLMAISSRLWMASPCG
jgi:hypothetical protein